MPSLDPVDYDPFVPNVAGSYQGMASALAPQAGFVPKQALPANFSSAGDANPLVRAMLDDPHYSDPRAMAAPPVDAIAPESLPTQPPLLAREALVGATRPLLDAGDYLGGVMGGQQPFNPAEATQEAVKLGSAFAGPKLGAGVIAGALAPGLRAVERAAPELEQAAAQGIRAFHGSPHDFDAFDLSKIGTGEGAQAYGHGLYC